MTGAWSTLDNQSASCVFLFTPTDPSIDLVKAKVVGMMLDQLEAQPMHTCIDCIACRGYCYQ